MTIEINIDPTLVQNIMNESHRNLLEAEDKGFTEDAERIKAELTGMKRIAEVFLKVKSPTRDRPFYGFQQKGDLSDVPVKVYGNCMKF